MWKCILKRFRYINFYVLKCDWLTKISLLFSVLVQVVCVSKHGLAKVPEATAARQHWVRMSSSSGYPPSQGSFSSEQNRYPPHSVQYTFSGSRHQQVKPSHSDVVFELTVFVFVFKRDTLETAGFCVLTFLCGIGNSLLQVILRESK